MTDCVANPCLGYGGGSHDNLDRLECWCALITAAIAIGIVLNALGIFLIRGYGSELGEHQAVILLMLLRHQLLLIHSISLGIL